MKAGATSAACLIVSPHQRSMKFTQPRRKTAHSAEKSSARAAADSAAMLRATERKAHRFIRAKRLKTIWCRCLSSSNTRAAASCFISRMAWEKPIHGYQRTHFCCGTRLLWPDRCGDQDGATLLDDYKICYHRAKNLDLTDAQATNAFFKEEQPEYVRSRHAGLTGGIIAENQGKAGGFSAYQYCYRAQYFAGSA